MGQADSRKSNIVQVEQVRDNILYFFPYFDFYLFI